MRAARVDSRRLGGGLLIDCVRLNAGVVDRIDVARQCVLEEPGLGVARVSEGAVMVQVRVQAAGSAFVAHGSLFGSWVAECRRCLDEVDGPLEIPFHEVFEWEPTEGETWPINNCCIELSQPVREAALLALPLAPLCSPDCAGPEPDRFPTGPIRQLSA